MPPTLTEAWASAYLQILIGLFVFALGIPAFIFQFVIHEDIRHVTERRMKTIWWKLSIFLLGTAAILFVWYLHPKPNETDVADRKKWMASLIVTLVPVAVAYFGLKLLGKFRRENVIDDLKKTLKKEYEINSSLEGRTLEDLIYLGKHSKAGYEKQLVLSAYADIVKAVQRNAGYKGEELKELIRSLIDILEIGEKRGNEENYCTGAELLESIRNTHLNILKSPQSNTRLAYQDADAVNLTLMELGISAVKSKPDRTALKLLNIGASCDNDIVLKMGLCAFRSKRFLIAVNALNILEWEVEIEMRRKHGNSIKPSEGVSRLLGLISHFFVLGGAARKRAQVFFTNESAESYTDLNACLNDAYDYHSNRTDFETADNIAALLKLTEDEFWPISTPA